MSKFIVPERVIYICTGSKCGKRGGKGLYKSLKHFTKHEHCVEAIRTDCTDRCDYAPVCSIQPENIWLKEYAEKDVLRLLKRLTEENS